MATSQPLPKKIRTVLFAQEWDEYSLREILNHLQKPYDALDRDFLDSIPRELRFSLIKSRNLFGDVMLHWAQNWTHEKIRTVMKDDGIGVSFYSLLASLLNPATDCKVERLQALVEALPINEARAELIDSPF